MEISRKAAILPLLVFLSVLSSCRIALASAPYYERTREEWVPSSAWIFLLVATLILLGAYYVIHKALSAC